MRNATTSAAFIVAPQARVDGLFVANAGGMSVGTAVVKVMTKVAASDSWSCGGRRSARGRRSLPGELAKVRLGELKDLIAAARKNRP